MNERKATAPGVFSAYNIIFLNMGMRAPSRAPDPPASDYACGGEGAYGVRARLMWTCKEFCSVSLSLIHRFCLRACMCINTLDITRRKIDTSTHTYKASFIHTNCGFTKQWLFRGRHNPGSGSFSRSLSFSLTLSLSLSLGLSAPPSALYLTPACAR
jgi:hypothetical protein